MMKEKGWNKKQTEKQRKMFSGCLFIVRKRVKSERINKEFHEEFQNKNDYFALKWFFKKENRKK